MFSTSHFHPMLVHFPIALVVFGFLAELAYLYFKKEVCLNKTSFYLLIVGTLTALMALGSGIFFTSEMAGSAGEAKKIHELFAWVTLGTLMITSILHVILMTRYKESSGLKWVAFIFYGLATVSVSITGFLGGTLVYNYMMPL